MNQLFLQRLLILHEGNRSGESGRVYDDATGEAVPEALLTDPDTGGAFTIGIGWNLRDNVIRLDEALLRLDNDIQDRVTTLQKRVSNWFSLNEVRQAVLIDMAFNMGSHKLLSQFPKTIGHVQRCEFADAATEMLDSRWATQVGRRSERLSKMMSTANWPDAVKKEVHGV